MSTIAYAMPMMPTCSQLNLASFVPANAPTVTRLNRAEVAIVVRKSAKIDEVLGSLYHVRGADVRFRFEILREKDRLNRLVRVGRPTNKSFDAVAQLPSAVREATRDYAKVVMTYTTTYGHSTFSGMTEGYQSLAAKLTALLQ